MPAVLLLMIVIIRNDQFRCKFNEGNMTLVFKFNFQILSLNFIFGSDLPRVTHQLCQYKEFSLRTLTIAGLRQTLTNENHPSDMLAGGLGSKPKLLGYPLLSWRAKGHYYNIKSTPLTV